MRILIAEDEFINQRLLQKYVSHLGECDIAIDGPKALEMVREAMKGGNHYDLIFLDIIMPGMDGLDVLKEIREMENKFNIPESQRAKIIMTTALADRQNVVRAAFQQCDAYLIKPVKPQEIMKKLKTLGLLKEEEEEKKETNEEKKERKDDNH